jgi:hypothetical protein
MLQKKKDVAHEETKKETWQTKKRRSASEGACSVGAFLRGWQWQRNA